MTILGGNSDRWYNKGNYTWQRALNKTGNSLVNIRMTRKRYYLITPEKQ